MEPSSGTPDWVTFLQVISTVGRFSFWHSGRNATQLSDPHDYILKSVLSEPCLVKVLHELSLDRVAITMPKHNVQVEVLLSRHAILRGCSKEVTDIFSPGDMVFGRLVFASRENFGILGVSVFLEGTSRNWVSTSPPTAIIPDVLLAERKFLSQALDIEFSQISQPQESYTGFTNPSEYRCSIDFHFIISTKIPSANEQAPDHCLQLPPSIEMGSVVLEKTTRKRYAQPSIIYAVKTSISFTGPNTAVPQSFEASVPISLRTHTIEYPPTATDDFPSEFRLTDRRSVKGWMFGRTFGTLTVSIQEPQAISFDDTTQFGLTSCPLHLQLFPKESEDYNFEALKHLRATVQPLIRIKTFYSLKTFPKLPCQKLLESEHTMRMREDLLRLDESKVSNFDWMFRHGSISSSSGASDASEASFDTAFSNISKPDGNWMARLVVPIRVKGPLVPTFCSSIVARLYTLIVRVKIAGIRREYFELEVPIQIIQPSPKPLYDDNSVFDRSNSTDDVHPEASISEFSEESLEEFSSPPNYFR